MRVTHLLLKTKIKPWDNMSQLDLSKNMQAYNFKVITCREGELSSSEATISWVTKSGFHCKTEHRLLTESEKLLIGSFLLVTD